MANAHNRGEHTLDGLEDLTDAALEPERSMGVMANHINHELNENTHLKSVGGGALHDAAALSDHTTERSVDEGTS